MKDTPWSRTLTEIKTVCFLAAMIPVLAAVAVAGLALLVVLTPQAIYERIRGRSPKRPWHSSRVRGYGDQADPSPRFVAERQSNRRPS
ncbi:MAG: hypothetical protein HY914_18505 [Desulfomonile tiedjei]|nr:hypothetical protein [Desulfomonile tiedjei]